MISRIFLQNAQSVKYVCMYVCSDGDRVVGGVFRVVQQLCSEAGGEAHEQDAAHPAQQHHGTTLPELVLRGCAE